MKYCIVFMDNYTSIKNNCNRPKLATYTIYLELVEMNIKIGNENTFFKNNLRI